MKINKEKKNKKCRGNGRIPKGSCSSQSCQRPDEDALALSDELDVDVASEFPGLKVEDSNVQTREEEEVVEYEPETFGKAADPVRSYLNEMKSFPLLSREGEVEIAKRIESGQQEVLSVVLNCPLAIKEVIDLGNALHAGKTTIKEVTNEIDNEETSIEVEKIQKKKVLNLINKIQRGEERIRILRGELRLRNKEVPKKRIQEKILKKRTKIFDSFKRINLREKQINRIVQNVETVGHSDGEGYNGDRKIREGGYETEGFRRDEQDRPDCQKEGRQNGVGMWPFFGSDQRGGEGD